MRENTIPGRLEYLANLPGILYILKKKKKRKIQQIQSTVHTIVENFKYINTTIKNKSKVRLLKYKFFKNKAMDKLNLYFLYQVN